MKADIAVVGAGALGLSTALHCGLRGRSVVVLDRRTPGSQASGRAAGLFKSVQGDEVRTFLARRSIDLVRTFAGWAGVPLDVATSGSLLIARSAGHKKLLATELAQSLSWGVDLAGISPAEAAQRTGGYCLPAGDEDVVWCPEDVYIEEPGALIDAYLDAARRAGVQVLADEPVTAVTVSGGAITGWRTAARQIETKVVVDAAGAWVRQVGELAGAWVAAAPVRHQLLVTGPLPGVPAGAPISRILDSAVYLRPARGGLMLGGFEAAPLAVDPRAEPPGFDTDDVPLDRGVLDAMAAAVADLVPVAQAAAAGQTVAEHRGGLFTMSPDGRVLAGPVPEVPGLWVASGCNGSGFSSSPAIGEALAAWITGGRPAVDLSSLSPARFGSPGGGALAARALDDRLLVERGRWQYSHYYDPPPA
ncbi:MAG TPA: FAD-dependent oxidoreductase [Streptosporangiaceae bacterium]|nr:FAD-dependent oxidoreductase [Streptosporangiaceae bacterium]